MPSRELRIFSWNVNGLRAVLRKHALQDFLEQYSPDILCLQEIKTKESQIDFDFASLGYTCYWTPAERPGYSGTGILVKDIDCKKLDFADSLCEGRITTLDLGSFYLVCVYTPNSKDDLSRLDLRETSWDPDFLAYLRSLEQTKPVITCGDFNAAHEEIDLARPDANHMSAGFTDAERQGITNILQAGFVDTFRALHPTEQKYSWWSYRGGARQRNVGWRIDYFFVSASLRSALEQADIHDDVTGSDHCPISITVRLAK